MVNAPRILDSDFAHHAAGLRYRANKQCRKHTRLWVTPLTNQSPTESECRPLRANECVTGGIPRTSPWADEFCPVGAWRIWRGEGGTQRLVGPMPPALLGRTKRPIRAARIEGVLPSRLARLAAPKAQSPTSPWATPWVRDTTNIPALKGRNPAASHGYCPSPNRSREIKALPTRGSALKPAPHRPENPDGIPSLSPGLTRNAGLPRVTVP
jgi:hypothetical protein